jgi:hypothetical protein
LVVAAFVRDSFSSFPQLFGTKLFGTFSQLFEPQLLGTFSQLFEPQLLGTFSQLFEPQLLGTTQFWRWFLGRGLPRGRRPSPINGKQRISHAPT